MPIVLVVEDDYLNMELTKLLLDNMGFSHEEVENGEDAIMKCREKFYDLILMDIMLPGMDGVEVSKKIKSDPAYKDVPIIAISAMKDREKYVALGFDDYIPKPIDANEFMKLMEKYK